MFDAATVCAHSGTYIHGPTPARFVRGATDRHAPDRDELEAPVSEPTHFVGRLETLENDIDCRSRRSHIVLPNGTRLRCGRPARRRDTSGRMSRARQGTTQRLPLERERPAAS